MVAYQVEDRDRYSAWQNGGVWVLGNRKNNMLTKVDIVSNNQGESFYGIVAYKGQETKNFRARLDKDNMYRAETKEYGSLSSWQSDGIWIIGSRSKQKCTKLNISSDNGKNLYGVMKYEGEEELEFKGSYIPSYLVENHWGKDIAPWHFGGIWALGNKNKKVNFIDIISKDLGESFTGNVQYEGEEMLSFKAERILGNNYKVYCQKSSVIESWYRCEDMIIGGRDNQRVIELRCHCDNSNVLSGTMAYEHEENIGFRATLIDD